MSTIEMSLPDDVLDEITAKVEERLDARYTWLRVECLADRMGMTKGYVRGLRAKGLPGASWEAAAAQRRRRGRMDEGAVMSVSIDVYVGRLRDGRKFVEHVRAETQEWDIYFEDATYSYHSEWDDEPSPQRVVAPNGREMMAAPRDRKPPRVMALEGSPPWDEIKDDVFEGRVAGYVATLNRGVDPADIWFWTPTDNWPHVYARPHRSELLDRFPELAEQSRNGRRASPRTARTRWGSI